MKPFSISDRVPQLRLPPTSTVAQVRKVVAAKGRLGRPDALTLCTVDVSVRTSLHLRLLSISSCSRPSNVRMNALRSYGKGCRVPLDDDLRELHFYSVSTGDTIEVSTE